MLFKEHGISGTGWLASPAEAWKDDEEFMKFNEFAKRLKVANDVAERGIKLMQDFIGSATLTSFQG